MVNASKMSMAATNHVQQVRGMRIRVIPRVRILRVVVMKLMELRTDAMQNRPILTSHKSVPAPWPGPAAATALSGGYCVQPASDAPPGAKKAASRTKKDTRVVQKPAMLNRGKAISEAPSCSGRK